LTAVLGLVAKAVTHLIVTRLIDKQVIAVCSFNPLLFSLSLLGINVAGIARVARFEQYDFRFCLRDWLMFDTTRDDYELSFLQDDVRLIPQLDSQFPISDKE
jgi:hypothetical protein